MENLLYQSQPSPTSNAVKELLNKLQHDKLAAAELNDFLSKHDWIENEFKEVIQALVNLNIQRTQKLFFCKDCITVNTSLLEPLIIEACKQQSFQDNLFLVEQELLKTAYSDEQIMGCLTAYLRSNDLYSDRTFFSDPLLDKHYQLWVENYSQLKPQINACLKALIEPVIAGNQEIMNTAEQLNAYQLTDYKQNIVANQEQHFSANTLVSIFNNLLNKRRKEFQVLFDDLMSRRLPAFKPVCGAKDTQLIARNNSSLANCSRCESLIIEAEQNLFASPLEYRQITAASSILVKQMDLQFIPNKPQLFYEINAYLSEITEAARLEMIFKRVITNPVRSLELLSSWLGCDFTTNNAPKTTQQRVTYNCLLFATTSLIFYPGAKQSQPCLEELNQALNKPDTKQLFKWFKQSIA